MHELKCRCKCCIVDQDIHAAVARLDIGDAALHKGGLAWQLYRRRASALCPTFGGEQECSAVGAPAWTAPVHSHHALADADARGARFPRSTLRRAVFGMASLR